MRDNSVAEHENAQVESDIEEIDKSGVKSLEVIEIHGSSSEEGEISDSDESPKDSKEGKQGNLFASDELEAISNDEISYNDTEHTRRHKKRCKRRHRGEKYQEDAIKRHKSKHKHSLDNDQANTESQSYDHSSRCMEEVKIKKEKDDDGCRKYPSSEKVDRHNNKDRNRRDHSSSKSVDDSSDQSEQQHVITVKKERRYDREDRDAKHSGRKDGRSMRESNERDIERRSHREDRGHGKDEKRIAKDSNRPTRDDIRQERDARREEKKPERNEKEHKKIVRDDKRSEKDERRPAKGDREERRPAKDEREERRPTRDEREERRPARVEREERRPIRDDREERRPTRDGREERKLARDDKEERRSTRDEREDRRSTREDREERKPNVNERPERNRDRSRDGEVSRINQERLIKQERSSLTPSPPARNQRRDNRSVPGPSNGQRRGGGRNNEDDNYEWGQKGESEQKVKEEPIEKAKPDFKLSGKLAEETNMVNGVLIKYSEPQEARMPKKRWRLYPFKGDQGLATLYIHRQSAYLIGRDRKIADIPVDHPSCSKQHAAFQYRLVKYTKANGLLGKAIRPYIIDLESANGTFLNSSKIESKKYIELREKDVLKFGFSSREYVLLHEGSRDDDEDLD